MTSAVQNNNPSSALAALMGTTDKSKASQVDSADQFLNLLVTQMKNQDPLNPMDNAQMTSQLAQINTVKGIAQLNASFEKLLGAYNDSMSMQSSSLIGKRILSSGSTLELGASGAIGGVDLSGQADNVSLVIKNAAGAEVARESLGNLPAGVHTFAWDGKGANGQQLGAGVYSFDIEATKGTNKVSASSLQSGMVSALVKGQSGFQLEVEGAGLIDFDNVKQIF